MTEHRPLITDHHLSFHLEFLPFSRHTAAVRPTACQEIKDSLRRPYLDDPHPWLVGFSGIDPVTTLVNQRMGYSAAMKRGNRLGAPKWTARRSVATGVGAG